MRKISTYFTQVQTEALQVNIPRETDEVRKRDASATQSDANGAVREGTTNATDNYSGNDECNRNNTWDPVQKPLDEDLEEAADEAMSELRDKQRELISSLNLSK
jgi:N-acetyltransferase 10